MIPYDQPLFWVLAVIGLIFTGISKSGFASGAGTVVVPLLTLTMPLSSAAALVLPLLLLMDARTIWHYRQHVIGSELRHIIPAALAGILLGSLVLGKLPENVLQLTLAILCILFACWQPLTRFLSQLRGAAWLWGGIAGFTSTLIHAGGPPINIYLIGRQLPKLRWLATTAIFFGVMNSVKLVPYYFLGQWNQTLLVTALILAPVALSGVWLGHKIQGRISEAGFMALCRVLLLSSGLILVAKAWL